MPDEKFAYEGLNRASEPLKTIRYKELNLNKPWNAFNLRHELTRQGIERFTEDFESTLRQGEEAELLHR